MTPDAGSEKRRELPVEKETAGRTLALPLKLLEKRLAPEMDWQLTETDTLHSPLFGHVATTVPLASAASSHMNRDGSSAAPTEAFRKAAPAPREYSANGYAATSCDVATVAKKTEAERTSGIGHREPAV